MFKRLLFTVLLIPFIFNYSQIRMEDPIKMIIDIGNYKIDFDRLYGDGGLQSQFSWNLTGENPQNTENFYYPAEQWQSNMLYQIFNPLVLDENGILDENGTRRPMYTRGRALTNEGPTDWASETRRYRPPNIVVDGIPLNPPYRWNVDPNLESDIKIEFEDILSQFGIRSHVEIFAFSNPNHDDYFIWKATHKFTGEIKQPRNSSPGDTLVDQTIKFWWPISFCMGPSKAGERMANGSYAFESEDDLSSWMVRKSELMPNRVRDSLHIAYYWDYKRNNPTSYPNGSSDESGDPDRLTGYLHSPQIPGFTLLHADRSHNDKSDDITQPYAMPYASIERDLWGRRDAGLLLTYRGDDARGRFPPDRATLGQNINKGPMRFITVGPYELTKDTPAGRVDSVTMVYAIGVGSIDRSKADSIGRAWYNGEISDSVKNAWIFTGKDSLFNNLDNANWAWDRLSSGSSVPSPPPPPDINVASGPARVYVNWSYESPSYFIDPSSGVDDWYAWRVYRKQGALLVNDPLDENSNAEWELVHETTDRNQTSFTDLNVTRGLDYYYAVTAVDDGSQNADGIIPNQRLESSRIVTRSQLPVTAFEPGLNESSKVRVVPNPATVIAGPALNAGSPDKISFFNLPVECTLKIFTETGDLIKTIEHFGTADEEWNQRTDDNQYITPGIYVLAVINAKDIDNNSLDNQFVKFVVVR